MFLRHGVATRQSLNLSKHIKVQSFRPTLNKIHRNYCAVNTSFETNSKINERARSTEILEVLDSPDKIERDLKHYRLVKFASCFFCSTVSISRVLKLKNGLTALLISDPILYPSEKLTIDGSKVSGKENERETDVEKLGACAVCVDVG